MFTNKLPLGVELEALTNKTIDDAVRLCEKHVGAGLYDRRFMSDIINKSNNYFYLLRRENKYIGYFYCLYTDALSDLSEFDTEPVQSLVSAKAKIGFFRSIGIDREFRGYGVSDGLVKIFADILFNNGCSQIFALAWKKNDEIPAKRHLSEQGFAFLCDVYRPWQKHLLLKCPYCRQTPCICDAALYYLTKEGFYLKLKGDFA